MATEVDGTEITATVWFEPDLTTWIGADQGRVIPDVVHLVGETAIEDTGFSRFPGVASDEIPEFRGGYTIDLLAPPCHYDVLLCVNRIEESLIDIDGDIGVAKNLVTLVLEQVVENDLRLRIVGDGIDDGADRIGG